MCGALKFAMLLSLSVLPAPAFTQVSVPSPAQSASAVGRQVVDAIAARIGKDIILESEVKDLQAFQVLVGGKALSREQVIRELVDQWIINQEATNASLPQPAADRVNASFLKLADQFSSEGEFRTKVREAGLTEGQVRSELAKQLYFNSLLRFRFRPTVVVEDDQIQAYYQSTLKPQLEKNQQPVPPLADVSSEIRSLLVEREIDRLAQQWLDETASHLNVDILPEDGS
jgi:peptidyl-prolyl cis-trans isomerase SurA